MFRFSLEIIKYKNRYCYFQTVKFNWTSETRGIVQSSFFWGYLVTQIPGGFLAGMYPANRYVSNWVIIYCFIIVVLFQNQSFNPLQRNQTISENPDRLQLRNES